MHVSDIESAREGRAHRPAAVAWCHLSPHVILHLERTAHSQTTSSTSKKAFIATGAPVNDEAKSKPRVIRSSRTVGRILENVLIPVQTLVSAVAEFTGLTPTLAYVD